MKPEFKIRKVDLALTGNSDLFPKRYVVWLEVRNNDFAVVTDDKGSIIHDIQGNEWYDHIPYAGLQSQTDDDMVTELEIAIEKAVAKFRLGEMGITKDLHDIIDI